MIRSNNRSEEVVNKLATFSRRMESNTVGSDGVEPCEGEGMDMGLIGKENMLTVVSDISTKKRDCYHQTMRKDKSCSR